MALASLEGREFIPVTNKYIFWVSPVSPSNDSDQRLICKKSHLHKIHSWCLILILATRKWDALVGNYHFQVSILNLWVFSIAPSPSCPLSPLLVASPLVAAEVVVVARVEVVAMGPRRSPNPQKFMWATSLTFHYIAIPCMVVWYIYLHEWLMFMVFMLVNIPYMDDMGYTGGFIGIRDPYNGLL